MQAWLKKSRLVTVGCAGAILVAAVLASAVPTDPKQPPESEDLRPDERQFLRQLRSEIGAALPPTPPPVVPAPAMPEFNGQWPQFAEPAASDVSGVDVSKPLPTRMTDTSVLVERRARELAANGTWELALRLHALATELESVATELKSIEQAK